MEDNVRVYKLSSTGEVLSWENGENDATVKDVIIL